MTQLIATQSSEVGINLTNDRLALNFEQERARRLEEKIEEALEEARAITQEKGIASQASAVAWDIVEELQAAACHRREQKQTTAFERYCEENPSALEALMYDV